MIGAHHGAEEVSAVACSTYQTAAAAAARSY
jgi:hypothetical protein